ncbi:MAG: RHS repeat-associated core domain-containing protein [Candidatus Thiodiazotropha sp.]
MKGRVTVGHPIDVATGTMHNDYTDVTIPGKVELTWKRFYSTTLAQHSSPLGSGWSNRYFCALTKTDAGYLFNDGQGSEVALDDPDDTIKQGGVVRNLGAFTEIRWQNNRFDVTQWDVDSGEIWSHVFHSQGNGEISALQELNDATGQGLEFAYDKDNARLRGIRQKLEMRTLVLRYSDQGQIEQVEFLSSDKKTRQTLVTYRYDNQGRLTEVVDAMGNSDHFDYDKNHRIILERNKDGGEFKFKYDTQGRCTRSVGIDGYDEKTLRFIDAAQWTEVTDSLDNIRRFQHNAAGQILREINPLGAEYLTKYDKHGRILSKTDPLGGVTRFDYDEWGNRCRITDALGQQTELVYNDQHLPVSYINAAGHIWRRIYDPQNRLTAVIDPQENSYRLDYDTAGNLVKITDPLGNQLRQSFTGTGELHAATDWQGNASTYQTDDFGRLVKKTDPLGAITRYEYDALNNLKLDVYPDGTTNSYEYDIGGNLIQVVDRNGNTTSYRYGSCKRLLERMDPLGNRLFFGWGTEPQRLEAVTNAKGEVYHFEYNAVGWVTGETGFDGREQHFEYDLSGNRIASTNGLGERINYQRDALGRLTQQRLPDGSTADFYYDAAGFLQSASNTDSFVAFDRDSLGRIIRETQNGHTIQRQYDRAGNMSVLESSLGGRIDYRFNANGMLKSFSKGGRDKIQIERDARGSEIGRILPGGFRLSQAYDDIGRLLEQELTSMPDGRPSHLDTPQALIKRSYRYDKAQLVSIQDQTWGEATYVYDPAEHLVAALRDNGASERFSYDVNDNLTKTVRDGKQVPLTYGCGDRLLTKGDTNYEYDDQGRLILKRETSVSGEILESHYSWDALDQLQSFTNPEGRVWEYIYDAFGRRIQKNNPDGGQHGFVWDGDVILDETQDNNLSASWAFDPHSFTPLCKYEKGEVYSVVTDHLGTPRELVDRFGSIVWQMYPFAWGDVQDQKKGLVDCPVRFQGQFFDSETGLSYNRFRYYEPQTGRYISQDPIQLSGGLNLYKYALNPILWNDIFGLICARQRAEDRARELRSRERRRLPTATSAVVDRRTGRVFYGYSGDRPTRISSRMLRQMPRESLEDWPVNNCAEFSAVNKALLKGARFEDLEVHTVRTATGEPFGRCENCRISTHGTHTTSD